MKSAVAGTTSRYSGRCRNLTGRGGDKKASGQKYVIHAHPVEGITVVDDLIREVTFENKVFDDPIIIKSDGLPTYNFCLCSR